MRSMTQRCDQKENNTLILTSSIATEHARTLTERPEYCYERDSLRGQDMKQSTGLAELALTAAIQIDAMAKRGAKDTSAVSELIRRLNVPAEVDPAKVSFAGVEDSLADATQVWADTGTRTFGETLLKIIVLLNKVKATSTTLDPQVLDEALQFCLVVNKRALAYDRGADIEGTDVEEERAFYR